MWEKHRWWRRNAGARGAAQELGAVGKKNTDGIGETQVVRRTSSSQVDSMLILYRRSTMVPSGRGSSSISVCSGIDSSTICTLSVLRLLVCSSVTHLALFPGALPRCCIQALKDCHRALKSARQGSWCGRENARKLPLRMSGSYG